MEAYWALRIAAGVLILFAAADWLRHGGGLTVKRRTWLLVAAIFLAISILRPGN